MRFEVLGPVRLVTDSGQIVRTSDLRRRLLAVLLARANRAVGTGTLTDVLWGNELPQRPDKSLQVHVHRIRQVLDRPERLRGVPDGYLLEIATGELDSDEFNEWHARARRELESGDPDTAIGSFRRALGLWRSAPYADIEGADQVDHEVRGLAEARLIAYEELYDVELARGAGREIVPELTELAAEYPLREHLTAQLMQALYRSGRRNRALAAYRQARRRLADQLRTEPGSRLRSLHQAILDEDPSALPDPFPAPNPAPDSGPAMTAVGTTGPAGQTSVPAGQSAQVGPAGMTGMTGNLGRPGHPGTSTSPSQLPPAPGAFAGRGTELAELAALTALSRSNSNAASGRTGTGRPEPDRYADAGAPLALITGMAGVGKTGLAVHYAHSVARHYSDGQLYIDLRGHASEPALRPIEALTHLLRSLGADTRHLPIDDVEAASAEYRSMLYGRRVLILLDNAASAEQVRPLLPATADSLTLVTSRHRLSGLIARDGARRLDLDVLPVDEARHLLTRLLGPARIANESDLIDRLTEACAGLPLAIRIAAAQLTDQPHRSLADYVRELQAGPLRTLRIEDDERAVLATAFDLSYHHLDPDTRRTFRLLGLVPGPDFTVDAAAALLGLSRADARHHLHRLVTAHLLDEHVAGRYRFHNLLRDHAALQADREPEPGGNTAVVERLLTWYWLGKDAVSQLLRPTRTKLPPPPLPDDVVPPALADRTEAAAWARAEHPGIAAAIMAAGSGSGSGGAEPGGGIPAHWSWHLAFSHSTVMADLGQVASALAIAQHAAEMARLADDPLALARSLIAQGFIEGHVRSEQAVATYREATIHAERSGNPILLSMALTNLGCMLIDLGELETADATLTRALEIRRETGAGEMAQAVLLHNLGVVAAQRGRFEQAATLYRQVIDLHEPLPSGVALEATARLQAIGIALGELDGVLAMLDATENSALELGEPGVELFVQHTRAQLLLDLGQLDAAGPRIEHASQRADTLGIAHYRAQAASLRGRILLRRGDFGPASVALEHGLQIARQAADYESTVDALLGLADAELAAGRLPAASTHAQEALALASNGHLPDQAAALTARSRIERRAGASAEAVALAERALAIQTETGHHLGRAHALRALAEAETETGGPSAAASAEAYLRLARRMFAEFGSPDAEAEAGGATEVAVRATAGVGQADPNSVLGSTGDAGSDSSASTSVESVGL